MPTNKFKSEKHSMSNYRRSKEGTSYFFTVVTYQKQPLLYPDELRNLLANIIREVRKSHPFEIRAWVLLPDLLHHLWELPVGDVDYSIRWALIKKEFTKRIKTITMAVTTNFQQYVKKGLYPEDWGGGDIDLQDNIGYE